METQPTNPIDTTSKRKGSQRPSLALVVALCVAGSLVLLGLGCRQRRSAPTDAPKETHRMLIGGKEPITLARLQSENGALPEFLSATVLPGRGMNLFQITAYIPGRGVTQLLASPTLTEAEAEMNGAGADKHGNLSYGMGGAFLLPYAGRVLGKWNAQTQMVGAEWNGQALALPANESGDARGSAPAARNGLLLDKVMDQVETNTMPDGGVTSAFFHAGDFGGHWPSQTDVSITIVLSGRALDCIVTAKNVGAEAEPMAIGWRPFFAIPSRRREQATLRVPSGTLAEMSDNGSVFPTGRLLPVAGTAYDFSQRGGRALGKTYLDQEYVNLKPGLLDSGPIVELRDPEANYGLRVTALSPQIKTLRVYSPLHKEFVVIEPQFNVLDPFGKEWKGDDTGMAVLQPGKSVTWKVRLSLFDPGLPMEPKNDQRAPMMPGALTNPDR